MPRLRKKMKTTEDPICRMISLASKIVSNVLSFVVVLRSFVSMLVELAIGDAYGAGFEYAADSIVREKNNLSAYVQHPRHDIRPGCYTDDTQMSVAVAEAIVSDEPWTPATLAQRFVTAFKRDPR